MYEIYNGPHLIARASNLEAAHNAARDYFLRHHDAQELDIDGPEGSSPLTGPEVQILFTTWGPVRGLGPLRTTWQLAARDVNRDRWGSSKAGAGAYSDRHIFGVNAEGYLCADDGRPIMHNGSGVTHPAHPARQ